MPFHSPCRIQGRRDDARGVAQKPGMIATPLIDQSRRIHRARGETPVAPGLAGFAAVAATDVTKMHLWANREVIVHGKIERHAKVASQPMNIQNMAQNVLDVEARDATSPQCFEKAFVIVLGIDRQGKRVLRTHALQNHEIPGRGEEQEFGLTSESLV